MSFQYFKHHAYYPHIRCHYSGYDSKKGGFVVLFSPDMDIPNIPAEIDLITTTSGQPLVSGLEFLGAKDMKDYKEAIYRRA